MTSSYYEGHEPYLSPLLCGNCPKHQSLYILKSPREEVVGKPVVFMTREHFIKCQHVVRLGSGHNSFDSRQFRFVHHRDNFRCRHVTSFQWTWSCLASQPIAHYLIKYLFFPAWLPWKDKIRKRHYGSSFSGKESAGTPRQIGRCKQKKKRLTISCKKAECLLINNRPPPHSAMMGVMNWMYKQEAGA